MIIKVKVIKYKYSHQNVHTNNGDPSQWNLLSLTEPPWGLYSQKFIQTAHSMWSIGRTDFDRWCSSNMSAKIKAKTIWQSLSRSWLHRLSGQSLMWIFHLLKRNSWNIEKNNSQVHYVYKLYFLYYCCRCFCSSAKPFTRTLHALYTLTLSWLVAKL